MLAREFPGTGTFADGRDLLFRVTLRILQVTGVKGVSNEVVMQQRIISTTYWLLAAEEISFYMIVFQFSDGHVDGDSSRPCVTTGPVCIPMYQLTQRFCGSYIIARPC